MIIPINTFTIHNIAGFMVTGSLAVTFYIVYRKSGRHILDLLSANFILCTAFMCLASFLSDNVVPAGASSLGWPGGPTAEDLSHSTLFFHRVHWSAAVLMMPTQLHFVLRYCDRRGVLLRNIRWAYALAFAAVPLVWTPLWFTARATPIAPTSSWNVAIPWMPDIGYPLYPFLVAYYWLSFYSVAALWQSNRQAALSPSETFMHRHMVLLAFVVQLLLGIVDLVFVFVGYNGVSLIPVGAILMGIVLAMALTRTRMEIDRQRQQLRQEKSALLDSVQQPLFYLAGDLRIQWANAAAGRFAQPDQGDLCGADLADLFDRATSESMLRPVRSALDSGQPQQAEVPYDGGAWIIHASPLVRTDHDCCGVIVLATDVTRIREAETVLRTANAKVLAAREEERSRVARDLHDSIAQSLVAAQMQLQGQAMALDDRTGETSSVLRLAADRCAGVAGELRQICHDLYPPTLDILGLATSLKTVVEQCDSTAMDCEIVVDEGLRKARFPQDVEIALYRLAQEAINNAMRHSQAGRVEVDLAHDDGQLVLTVT